MLGDPVAHAPPDVVLKGARLREPAPSLGLAGAEKAEYARGDDVRGQAVRVRLERVGRAHAVRVDLGPPFHRYELLAEQFERQLLDSGVAKVQPVPGDVEVEAAAGVRSRHAACRFFAL